MLRSVNIIRSFKVLMILLSMLMLAATSAQAWDWDSLMTRAAPELRGGLDWINTSQPPKLKDLRGKFVVLDFWTYACINCLHVQADLKRLEEKYRMELVVIGVHSAKFRTEKDSKNIREAVDRYAIRHPVVNDPNLRIWRDYDIAAWPTVVLIDPAGKIIFQKSGEGVFDPLDRIIKDALPKSAEILNRSQIAFGDAQQPMSATPLRFPGKVLADLPGGRLFIADSGHHRIVVADLNGQVRTVLGDGVAGDRDGDFLQARFHDPQGMVLLGKRLYIADRANHKIRVADLETRQVTTVAGTGQKGNSRDPKGTALSVPLNSPWDLAAHKGNLYIAMAGNHQIWALDLTSGMLRLFVGSGLENIKDGPALKSNLAQPSGLAGDGTALFFVDSETSALRRVELSSPNNVSTLIGQGLFDFGDRDGARDTARLQHPLGVATMGSLVAVADTYNNKIKVFDPLRAQIRTLAGNGRAGLVDGPLTAAQFNEPAGISYAGDKIFVADTNNHALRLIDLKAGIVQALTLSGLDQTKGDAFDLDDFRGEVVALDQPLPRRLNKIRMTVTLPPGFKFLDAAGSFLKVRDEKGRELGSFEVRKLKDSYSFSREIPGRNGYFELVLYYCSTGKQSLCLVKRVLFKAVVDPAKSSSDHSLDYRLTNP